MERSVLLHHHHHDDTHNIKPSGSLVLFGDAIHNLIDGIAIATTVMISPIAGISAAIGIAAHEIPQEFADFMILVNSGYEKKGIICAIYFRHSLNYCYFFGNLSTNLILLCKISNNKILTK